MKQMNEIRETINKLSVLIMIYNKNQILYTRIESEERKNE